MDRWQNKVAVVTGASAGIGAAVVKELLKSGLIVVGLARRQEKVAKIVESLPKNLHKNLHPMKCDVSNEKSVNEAFDWIEKNLGGADILINNAGIVRATELVEPNNTNLIKEVMDTNVMGVVYCTRSAFNSMKMRNVAGHIVIINSIAGHQIPNLPATFPSLNIYPASKHAITAMTEVYRQEFHKNGTKVKITSISPGAVETDIFTPGMEDEITKNSFPMLRPEDIAGAILYVLSTPPNVQVHELTIKPIGELF